MQNGRRRKGWQRKMWKEMEVLISLSRLVEWKEDSTTFTPRVLPTSFVPNGEVIFTLFLSLPVFSFPFYFYLTKQSVFRLFKTFELGIRHFLTLGLYKWQVQSLVIFEDSFSCGVELLSFPCNVKCTAFSSLETGHVMWKRLYRQCMKSYKSQSNQ